MVCLQVKYFQSNKNPMEESKYYFPDPSEFCVGFKYEVDGRLIHTDSGIKDWTGETFGSDPKHLYFATNPNYDKMSYGIRVKYLDRQDIESCGWKMQVNSHYNQYNIHNEYNSIILKMTNDNFIVITDDYEVTRFRGTIKNISELKRIMKMIGINE